MDALSDAGFVLIDVEDVEPFVQRITGYQVDPALKELALAAQEDGEVKFGTFHTYPVTSNGSSEAKSSKRKSNRQ